MKPYITLILAMAAVIAIILLIILWPRPAIAPQSLPISPSPTSTVHDSSVPSTPALTKVVRAKEVAGVASAFEFAAMMPTGWEVESVPSIEAINLFDPAAPGANNLEKSQIFIRYFRANDFQTLSTVTIHQRSPLTINNRAAVRYDIEKKPEVANFTSQPLWRNQRHIVTDIRISDSTPATFYVIAKRPDVNQELYEAFLQSLQVTATASNFGKPTDEFESRVTRKPFGIFITPQTSPVQPERFSGYHTGADAEYDDITTNVSVKAIAAGTVLTARTASGYGGVIAVQHEINGEPMVAVYGHLDPQSLVKAGTTVAAGDELGILGEGNSAETDGERKHLHLALRPGTSVDLRGYVQNKAELSAWRDPVVLLKQ